ncbi:MAG: 2-hydroxyacyl-CoA dehydratase [Deltaproteobacteria bacterium]|nr:2-hydroxyacyl-CoA dehydratase [Deltaproteobacteria bacterium]
MIGITTTVPLEIPLAAGKQVFDLNNLFINHEEPRILTEEAELAGFPRNTCGWIKGIYGIIKRLDIRELIAVTEGDCSNTRALMEVLATEGIRAIPFAFPFSRSKQELAAQLEGFAQAFGVTFDQAGAIKKDLDRIRAKIVEIDRLTWQENRVSGFENHLFLVSSSDMKGDPAAFEAEIDAFLIEARNRPPFREKLRLAYVGVPPIFTDIYSVAESLEGRFVFNETQRQFVMPSLCGSLTDQYLSYTYPYGIFARLEDIRTEIERRHVDGLIHYVQSFCFRQIEDIVLKKELSLPILTLEGDQPGPLDPRTRLRLESFLEMLKARKTR